MISSPGATGADVFSAAAQRIVDYLNANTPLTDWSVSRVAAGEQVHLHVHEGGLLHVGRRVPWDDTFCIRMANGASRIVADAQTDPDYADHPDAKVIRAYAGFPIVDDEGNTFGTLCGVGTTPLAQPEDVDADLIALMGELLSSQLRVSQVADRDRRSAEVAAALASTDGLTGLVNRRGWDLLVEDAQQRISAYGDPVAVGVIDLNGLKIVNDSEGHAAGDQLLRRAADALTAAASLGDQVARYGGDEFAILANDVAMSDLAEHFDRFGSALAAEGISASMGHAATSAGDIGVLQAFTLADAAMYRAKHSVRS